MALRLFLLCLALALIVLKEGFSKETLKCSDLGGYPESKPCTGSCARVLRGNVYCPTYSQYPKLTVYDTSGQCLNYKDKGFLQLNVTGGKFWFVHNCVHPLKDCNEVATDLEKKYKSCVWPYVKLDRPECACNAEGMDFRKSHEARIDGRLKLGQKGEEAVRKSCKNGKVSTREVRLLMYNQLDIFQQLYFGCFVTKNNSKGIFIFSEFTYAYVCLFSLVLCVCVFQSDASPRLSGERLHWRLVPTGTCATRRTSAR